MNGLIEATGLSGVNAWTGVLILTVICVILLVLLIVEIMKVNKLSARCDSFMRGADGKSLENDIDAMFDENERIRDDLSRCGSQIDNIYFKLKSSIQKVGVVKYDAFSQLGGMLSYAVALLDETNSGVMINSVHSADGCYSYIKVIRNGKSDVDLGAEEEQALANALSGFRKKQ